MEVQLRARGEELRERLLELERPGYGEGYPARAGTPLVAGRQPAHSDPAGRLRENPDFILHLPSALLLAPPELNPTRSPMAKKPNNADHTG